jgi:hypothetical protein
MAELFNWIVTLAYFAIFIIGLLDCFKDAKLSWITRSNTGLTVFERRSYILKAGSSISLAVLALVGLFDAAKGVF